MADGLTQDAGNVVLEFLLARHSDARLTEPGPDDAELNLLLKAALRVPDFRHLRPYRFLVARGAGRDRLGEAMRRAAIAADKPDDIVARAPRMPHRAPLVIVVVASPKEDKYVPLFDQQLCAGAAVLTMQLAALALGYGGIWRSGWLMYDRGFHRELGLGGHEQIVGFLYLGTPASPVGEEEHSAAPEAGDDVFTWL
jgi:nitroreductase